MTNEEFLSSINALKDEAIKQLTGNLVDSFLGDKVTFRCNMYGHNDLDFELDEFADSVTATIEKKVPKVFDSLVASIIDQMKVFERARQLEDNEE